MILKMTDKAVRLAFLLILAMMVALTAAASAVAIPILTFDSDGTPAQLDRKVEQNPVLFIKKMKSDLRRGNLANIGFISRRLLKIKY